MTQIFSLSAQWIVTATFSQFLRIERKLIPFLNTNIQKRYLGYDGIHLKQDNLLLVVRMGCLEFITKIAQIL